MEINELTQLADQYNKRIRMIGIQNNQVKWIKDIINNKRPNPKQICVIEGVWAHQKAYQCGIMVDSLFICPELINSHESKSLVGKYIQLADNIYALSEKVFSHISEFDHNSNGLISACYCNRTKLSEMRLSSSMLLIVLDGIEIPGNAGTIVRSADGAHANGVVFCNKKVRLSHPKFIRSSQCASFSVPLFEAESSEFIAWLVQNSFRILLLDSDAPTDYHEANYSGRVAIVAGSERYGISSPWYDVLHESVSIPMMGISDSLNVGVATTLVIYEAMYKQLNHKAQS